MSWPSPTRQDHLRFCEIEGWSKVRSSKGRTGTHHYTYELTLESGDVLRTRISRPPDRTDYGRSLWKHILRDQLKVPEAEFWECINSARPPNRTEVEEPESDPLPTGVVWNLINRVGLSEEEVAAMDRDEAIERLNQFWITGE